MPGCRKGKDHKDKLKAQRKKTKENKRKRLLARREARAKS